MKTKFVSVTACAAILVGLLLLPACDSSDPGDDVNNNDFVATADYSRTIPVVAHSLLRLNGINGLVEVTALAGATSVSIKGDLRVASDSQQDANDHLELLEVVVSDLDDEIVVETEQPQNSGGRSYTIDYEITVPETFDVRVSNINGNVEIHDVGGQIVVNLTNGILSCETSTPPNGAIRLSTVNGNVELDIPTSISATFSATVVNGHINVNNLPLTNVSTTPVSMTGMLGDGDEEITLSTVNGSIEATGHD